MIPEPRPARNVRRAGVAVLVLAVSVTVGACASEERQARSGDHADTAPAARASIPTTPDVQSCGDLGYTPQSDNGAFSIKATGVSCATAREVAELSRGFPPTFRAHGFTCRTEGPVGQLPSHPYTCTAGDGARITFKAS